jgi:hypothetical protein
MSFKKEVNIFKSKFLFLVSNNFSFYLLIIDLFFLRFYYFFYIDSNDSEFLESPKRKKLKINYRKVKTRTEKQKPKTRVNNKKKRNDFNSNDKRLKRDRNRRSRIRSATDCLISLVPNINEKTDFATLLETTADYLSHLTNCHKNKCDVSLKLIYFLFIFLVLFFYLYFLRIIRNENQSEIV